MSSNQQGSKFVCLIPTGKHCMNDESDAHKNMGRELQRRPLSPFLIFHKCGCHCYCAALCLCLECSALNGTSMAFTLRPLKHCRRDCKIRTINQMLTPSDLLLAGCHLLRTLQDLPNSCWLRSTHSKREPMETFQIQFGSSVWIFLMFSHDYIEVMDLEMTQRPGVLPSVYVGGMHDRHRFCTKELSLIA